MKDSILRWFGWMTLLLVSQISVFCESSLTTKDPSTLSNIDEQLIGQKSAFEAHGHAYEWALLRRTANNKHDYHVRLITTEKHDESSTSLAHVSLKYFDICLSSEPLHAFFIDEGEKLVVFGAGHDIGQKKKPNPKFSSFIVYQLTKQGPLDTSNVAYYKIGSSLEKLGPFELSWSFYSASKNQLCLIRRTKNVPIPQLLIFSLSDCSLQEVFNMPFGEEFGQPIINELQGSMMFVVGKKKEHGKAAAAMKARSDHWLMTLKLSPNEKCKLSWLEIPPEFCVDVTKSCYCVSKPSNSAGPSRIPKESLFELHCPLYASNTYMMAEITKEKTEFFKISPP